jgi:hypothetical protein
MTSFPYCTWFPRLKQWSQTHFQVRFRRKCTSRPDLHPLAQRSADLPGFVQESPVAMRYLRLLWDRWTGRASLSATWILHGRFPRYHSPRLSLPVWLD